MAAYTFGVTVYDTSKEVGDRLRNTMGVEFNEPSSAPSNPGHGWGRLYDIECIFSYNTCMMYLVSGHRVTYTTNVCLKDLLALGPITYCTGEYMYHKSVRFLIDVSYSDITS